MSDIIATLHPSAPRRVLGVAALLALGGFLLWLALGRPPEAPVWRLFLLGAGGLALYLAERMRRATAQRLELTREVLRESGGRVLARIDEVRSIERGVFALKPSSGFLLRLHGAGPAVWAPGLWWRFGRSLGVGGVTGKDEGRYMAEVIAAMLAERTGARPG